MVNRVVRTADWVSELIDGGLVSTVPCCSMVNRDFSSADRVSKLVRGLVSTVLALVMRHVDKGNEDTNSWCANDRNCIDIFLSYKCFGVWTMYGLNLGLGSVVYMGNLCIDTYVRRQAELFRRGQVYVSVGTDKIRATSP